MNKSLALIFWLILSLCSIGAAQTPEKPDIPPKKGDISKNIHIIFDKSGSMSSDDFARGYAEVEKIIMQNSDEFNLAVTVFGAGHIRMPVNDKDCALGKNWLAMPSAIHYKNVMRWIRGVEINNEHTSIVSAINGVLKENKEKVTIIVISDCIIDDVTEALGNVKSAVGAKGKDKRHPMKIGFVNVNKYIPDSAYKNILKHKCWYIALAAKKRGAF